MPKYIAYILGGALALVVGLSGGLYISPQNQKEQSLGYRENTLQSAVLSNATTTAVGATVSVVYYRNLGIDITSEGSTGTVKFACSLLDTTPDFSVGPTVTNTWDYVQVVDTEDGNTYEGDTGIVLANSTDVRQFEMNSNNFRWCTAILSASGSPSAVSGTTTVMMKPADNS